MLRSVVSSKTRPLKLPVLNGAALKVAELATRAIFGGGQTFAASRWHELNSFGPNVIVGSASELQRMIERIDLRTIELPSIDHAIFVLTEIGDRPLSDPLRVTLWQRFGVPVYEIYLGPDRQMLARECEAQEGWHVEPGVQFFMQGGQLSLQTGDVLFQSGLASKLETSPCPCGRPGLRIVPPGSVVGTAKPHLAASA